MPDSDPDSALWAIELRDVQEKKVYFAVIDLEVPSLKYIISPEATDWWTSLTAFSSGNIFLHNYRYPDLPEPTDLLMLGKENGQLEWVLPNHLLVKRLNDLEVEVATRRGDQFVYLTCKTETGELSGSGIMTDHVEPQVILAEPVRYKEGNVYFPKLADFIRTQTAGHEPVCIDYLEKRPVIMFSYYLYEQEKMSEYLLIVSDKMERILHEKLSAGRDGIGQSTMFLKGSKLVYLKNNDELSSLTLS